MRKTLKNILFPLVVVGLLSAQTFGFDMSRMSALFRNNPNSSLSDSSTTYISTDSSITYIDDSTKVVVQDSIIKARITDSIKAHKTDSIKAAVQDSIQKHKADSIKAAVQDSIAKRKIFIDSILASIPDSLEYKDSNKYKYYLAIKDSFTRRDLIDTLLAHNDTIQLAILDSLYKIDSTELALEKFKIWYAGLSRKERKKYDYEQALPAKIARIDSILARKDSIQAYKDSVRENTPRILETFALVDSLHYKRTVVWNLDRDFQDLKIQKIDTTFNYYFHDEPFMRKDVNATWLGVSGSPVQTFNYFKRDKEENAIFYTPYQAYSYSPGTLPMYNTKTPYTELAYWGTLFAKREKEEMNVRVWTSQNILPGLNLTLGYYKFGGKGILAREDIENKNAVAAINYLGKKYMLHTGFIYNKITRSENGGIVDSFWIRDTTVDAREISINLKSASNTTKKRTFYLDQTYRIPFTFIEKIRAKKDSTYTYSADSLNTDITTAFIGHSSELSTFAKLYNDKIGATDTDGRDFFNNQFFLNPTTSYDSLSVMKFDNKVFMRLQPWASNAALSKIDFGIGDKLVSYYDFDPRGYIEGRNKKHLENSLYLYAGVNGQIKEMIRWDAKGRYTFLGTEINDFNISANLKFSFYPFRKNRKSPLDLNIHFETDLKEPDYYQKKVYTNHYKWDNDFRKISTTKIVGEIDIPYWKMNASFGYALLGNNVYFDAMGNAAQDNKTTSIISASLMKNFKLWKFHFDHKALFQLSSNQEVLPLPMLSLNLRYYFQFPIVKNVLEAQLGIDGYFTTKWYAPGYNPVLGVFYNQRQEQYGNCPYFDAFINLQWHQVCIFVKYMNAGQGWPMDSADYFTAHGSIYTQRAFKIGVFWPFNIQSKKPGSNHSHNHEGAHSGMGGGGGRTSRHGAAGF